MVTLPVTNQWLEVFQDLDLLDAGAILTMNGVTIPKRSPREALVLLVASLIKVGLSKVNFMKQETAKVLWQSWTCGIHGVTDIRTPSLLRSLETTNAHTLPSKCSTG